MTTGEGVSADGIEIAAFFYVDFDKVRTIVEGIVFYLHDRVGEGALPGLVVADREVAIKVGTDARKRAEVGKEGLLVTAQDVARLVEEFDEGEIEFLEFRVGFEEAFNLFLPKFEVFGVGEGGGADQVLEGAFDLGFAGTGLDLPPVEVGNAAGIAIKAVQDMLGFFSRRRKEASFSSSESRPS